MNRAIFVYDGACAFCIRWAIRWQRWTRGRVDFVPYQTADVLALGVEAAECAREAKLRLPTGELLGGAEAVLGMVACRGGVHVHWIRVYRRYRIAARIADRVYRFVAAQRRLLYRWTP
ncbi:DUF393 domain-containing protein [candidate division KSB1 bacterium]|nr:DUF393 domain-containing protein [candidate division KSB1 bacterium]